ncbi:MAG: hypothetical protein KY462_04040 [Actinobacteria bacterium]|nr:hypothetical protein [Actinomycetota bacterium]
MIARRPTSHADAPTSSDAGSAPLELALGAGLLLFPVAILALSFPVWVERQSMAQVAAQEAARAAVLAEDPRTAAASAVALVARSAANHQVAADDVRVCFSVHAVGSPPGACTGLTGLPRGAAVTAHVTVRLPTLPFPGLRTAVGAVNYTVRHTEQVDTYRGFGEVGP